MRYGVTRHITCFYSFATALRSIAPIKICEVQWESYERKCFLCRIARAIPRLMYLGSDSDNSFRDLAPLQCSRSISHENLIPMPCSCYGEKQERPFSLQIVKGVFPRFAGDAILSLPLHACPRDSLEPIYTSPVRTVSYPGQALFIDDPLLSLSPDLWPWEVFRMFLLCSNIPTYYFAGLFLWRDLPPRCGNNHVQTSCIDIEIPYIISKLHVSRRLGPFHS